MLAPAGTVDQPASCRVCGFPLRPPTDGSTPSSPTPSRQFSDALSRGSPRPARGPDPAVLGGRLPGGPAGSARLLGHATQPRCVHPTHTPARWPGWDSQRPRRSRPSPSAPLACEDLPAWFLIERERCVGTCDSESVAVCDRGDGECPVRSGLVQNTLHSGNRCSTDSVVLGRCASSHHTNECTIFSRPTDLFTTSWGCARRSRTAFSCPKRGILLAAEVAISGKTGIISHTCRSKNQRACAHSTRRVIRQHYLRGAVPSVCKEMIFFNAHDSGWLMLCVRFSISQPIFLTTLLAGNIDTGTSRPYNQIDKRTFQSIFSKRQRILSYARISICAPRR